MDMKQRLARNVSLKLLAEVLSGLFGFLLFLALTRWLGDAKFGQYAFVLAFTGLFAILMDCGANTLLMRDLPKGAMPPSLYLASLFRLKTLLSALTAGLILTTIHLLDYPPETESQVRWGVVLVIAISWIDTICFYFNAIERIEYEVLLKTLQRLAGAATGISLLLWQREVLPVLQGMAGVYLATVGLGLGLILRQLPNRRLPPGDWRIAGNLLKQGLPFWLAGLFMILYFKLDLVMLSLFGRSHGEIGWYGAVVKLIGVITVLPHLVMLGFFPAMAQFHTLAQPDVLAGLFRQATKLLWLLALPLVLGGQLLAEELILAVLGPEYWPAVPVFQLLLWSLPFAFTSFASYYTLAAIHRQQGIVWAAGSTLVLNGVLNLGLIPTWGYLGASLSTILCEGLCWLLLAGFLVRALPDLTLPRGLLRSLLANLLLALAVWQTQAAGLPWFAIIAGAIPLYMSLLYSLKVIDAEDLRLLASPWRKGAANA